MNKTYIKIRNKGEVDINAFHLMGVSSKREDSNKIGFFGSGNKYAIAVLLRNKINFKIFSGKREIDIKTEQIMFRSTLHERIIINGEPTSLTTSMGIDWENWFAIRELYCNAVDEGHDPLTISKELVGDEGYTTVYVELTEEFGKFFKNINNYIIVSDEPIDEVKTVSRGKVKVYKSDQDEFICYRKDIRIYPENSNKSLYRYNFQNISINESRTYSYEYQIKEGIAQYLASTENEEVIENYIKNWKNVYEKDVYWDWVHTPLSNSWEKILSGKRVYPEGVAIMSGDYEGKHNSVIVPDELAKKISKDFPDIHVVGFTKGKEFTVVKPNSQENEKISKAKSELKNIGFDIQQEIILCVSKMEDVVGWYDSEEDKIYLTRKYLGEVDQIKNTLLEEYFHSTGHQDGRREFITFLIDELIEAKTSLANK